MSLSPTVSPQITHTSPYLSADQTIDQLDNDFQDLSLPSSSWNPKSYKRQGPGRRKAKAQRNRENRTGGDDSALLKLPEDVLKVLLVRIPPRSLAALAATCTALRSDLEDDAIWRRSYVHHFAGEGVNDAVIKTLVQPCAVAGQGWRNEALEREHVLEQWRNSKSEKTHDPNVGPIHALSLAYPQSTRPALIIGKTRSSAANATLNELTPTRETLKSKYEQHIATTTRPAPYILSAGLAVGGIVRSDPLSGKLSKGYWGPQINANFHLRPHLDTSDPPTAIYMERREQKYAIWGLQSGKVVRSLMSARSHTANRTRAATTNVSCAPEDAHEGLVECLYATSGAGDTFVSGGSDGRVKFWRYGGPVETARRASTPRIQRDNSEGASSPSSDPGRLICAFSSTPADTTFADRPEDQKLRIGLRPDGIICARYDEEADILCSVTVDGDLRVFFGVLSGAAPIEVRVDVGSRAEYGGVSRIELNARDGVAGVLVLHAGQSDLVGSDSDLLLRFNVREDGSWERTVFSGAGHVTALHVNLTPTDPIVMAMSAIPSPIPSPLDNPDSPPILDVVTPSAVALEEYGRYIIAGNTQGECSWYAWDSPKGQESEIRYPLRRWKVGRGSVSDIDAAASLVAVGTSDGQIRLFDPLPSAPVLLRSFHTVTHSATAHSTAQTWLSLSPRRIILDSDLLLAACGNRICSYRAAPRSDRSNQNKDKTHGHKKKSVAGSSMYGQGASMFSPKELKAAQKEARLELDEQREGRAKRDMQAVERQSGNAGLGEDEALQYAMLLSMEQIDQDGSSRDGVAASTLSLHTHHGYDDMGYDQSYDYDEDDYYDGYEDDDDREYEYGQTGSPLTRRSYASASSNQASSRLTLTSRLSSTRTTAGSSTPSFSRNIYGDEDDEFAGMSDGEKEAIKAVEEFEKQQL